MKRGVVPHTVNIEVGGVVVGILQLLGSDAKTGSLCLLLSSSGEIPGLTYICEGVFDEVEQLVDEQGSSGNVLVGKRLVGKSPALETVLGKIEFTERLARHMANKIEAQQPKR